MSLCKFNITFVKYNNYKYTAKCENLLAVVYTNTGNYNKAIEHYIHSIKIFEKLNNVNGLIMTFTNLGTLNRLQKRYDKAFGYYLKAYNISKKFTNKIDKNLIAQIYANVGIVFDDLKKWNDISIDEIEELMESLENFLSVDNLRLKLFRELGSEHPFELKKINPKTGWCYLFSYSCYLWSKKNLHPVFC